jgi:hypothetical protein
MTRTGIILLIVAFTIGFKGCVMAQGLEQENREVSSFNGISVSSGIKLFLTQGENNQVVVKADGAIIDDVVTKTENGTLRIYVSTRNLMRLDSSPEVYVTFSWINSIESSAGSEVLGQNKFMLDKLNVQNSSGSSSNFEVECRDMEMKASSGASIVSKGSSLNLIAKSSSGSSIKSKDLKVINANLEVSSGAEIVVHVSGELEASASSGGSISYYGEAVPKLLQQSSGGDIKKR